MHNYFLDFLIVRVSFFFLLRPDQQYTWSGNFRTVKENASLIGKTTNGEIGKPNG